MTRDEVIQVLEEATANHNSLANESRRSADNARAAGWQWTAKAEAEKEARHRYSAGFCAATINHINGVSPE